jgi:hypothetical protein
MTLTAFLKFKDGAYVAELSDGTTLSDPLLYKVVERLLEHGVQQDDVSMDNKSALNKLKDMFPAVKAKDWILVRMYTFEFETRMS